MAITHKGLLKAVQILKKEPRYVHDTFGDKNNCHCALGAIAVAHDMYEHFGGQKHPDGFGVSVCINRMADDDTISNILGILEDVDAKVTRSRAIKMVQKIDAFLFGKKKKVKPVLSAH